MPAKAKKTAEREQPKPETMPTTDPISAAGFLMKWNAELTRFYAERYRQYWLAPVRMMSCRSLEDIQELQNDFRNELFDAYRSEAATLSAIVTEQRHSSGDGFHEGYAEGLLKAQEDAAVIIEQAKRQAEQIMSTAHETAAQVDETSGETEIRKRA